jgi:hypothetical protein
MKNFKFFRGENIVWVDSFNIKWNIEDLFNIHIENIMNCLRGNGMHVIPNPYRGRTHTEWISIFEKELNSRK